MARIVIAQQRPRATVQLAPGHMAAVRRTAEKVARQVEQLRGHGGFVEDVNRDSVRWISVRAAKNLDKSMRANGRPTRFNSGKLRGAILAYQSHEWDAKSFAFMVDEKVRPRVPYYAALEYGDRSQIGRQIYFSFLSASRDRDRLNLETDAGKSYRHPRRPNLRRGNRPTGQGGMQGAKNAGGSSYKSDRIVGPRERAAKSSAYLHQKAYRVTIRRPVPEYSYGRRAGEEFLQGNEYSKALKRVAKRWEDETKVKIVFGTRQV